MPPQTAAQHVTNDGGVRHDRRVWTVRGVQSTSSYQRKQVPRVLRSSRIHEPPALRDLVLMINVDADHSAKFDA